MSYHVNKDTMLFDDLHYNEACELSYFCRGAVLNGKAELNNCEAFKSWVESSNYSAGQALFTGAEFMQRALLSVAEYWKDLYSCNKLIEHEDNENGGNQAK